ncbi:hypothetical protein D0869_00131 [Hortaea werneckii]|uniref:Uncharacterized protein n=3 Tax=Hortaea werneckii TaxID=91943 RepID=A0A3M6XIH8_HORWE|nr:hypothetical protein D0869_00131 [Hortaea werneckii]RMY17607.1 hypothetical protein D0867_05903 [Hortaea werneckii]
MAHIPYQNTESPANSPLASTMPAKQVISTDKAPMGLKGIYSQAIVANGTVYCSGSVAMDPATGQIIDGDVGAHTHQCIKNLTNVLEAAGTTIENVVKVNVFLADMKDFAAMNEVYAQYWGEQKPCRTCVAAKQLPRGTDVEIECIAVMP